MTEEGKSFRAVFVGDSPMELTVAADGPATPPEQSAKVRQVTEVIVEYLKAAKTLLNGRYAHLKHLAPAHLAEPGNVIVVLCTEGVVVRYEKKAEPQKVLGTWSGDPLPEVVSLLSQQLVLVTLPGASASIDPAGVEIKLAIVDGTTGERREIISDHLRFELALSKPEQLPVPPSKPYCPLSVRATMEMGIQGQLIGNNENQNFVVRTPIRLAVGWECIELFPFLNLSSWKTQFAPSWAENDILASVAARQFHEAHYQSIDPNAQARKQYAVLLDEFKRLLDSEPGREEVLQQFLRDNPFLLCPAHTKMWPKLALGARKTDFVFLEANREYLLVELERSTYELFRDDDNQTQQVTIALGQITDWKRYIEDNLRTVQSELGLVGISSNPKGLVVIGRSLSLSEENRRKLRTMHNTHPTVRICTYDDVYDNAKATLENVLGPIWNPGEKTNVYLLK